VKPTVAVRHAPGPCTLYLIYQGPFGHNRRNLTVAISDTSTALPTPRTPDLTTGTGGLGWHMMLRTSTDIQIHQGPPHGKTIDVTLNVMAP